MSHILESNLTKPSPECVSSEITLKFFRKSAFSVSESPNIRVID